VPVDPVCGIEMDESLALIHEHDGEKYYFCCNGCKKIFVKKSTTVGLADGILKADGNKKYSAENLKVGLFT